MIKLQAMLIIVSNLAKRELLFVHLAACVHSMLVLITCKGEGLCMISSVPNTRAHIVSTLKF